MTAALTVDGTATSPRAVSHFARVGAATRPLKVLTDDSYPVPFNIDLGQANACLHPRRLSRHMSKARYRSYNVQALTLERGGGFDLMHTFNAVPLRPRCPFVVTFESRVPRIWDRPDHHAMHERLVRHLLSPRCKALIAISRYALGLFQAQYQRDGRFEQLRAKTHLIYPSVPEQPVIRPKADRALRLLFVGREFMRKGLPAVTRAHQALRAQGVPVETTVISSLDWRASCYIGPDRGYDVEAERRLLAQPDLIHLREVPNAAVRELMRHAHFTLLPTLHDTFGYSAIESLACGTPVIATDTCALPEIIDHRRNGYLLPLENLPGLGHWIGTAHRPQPVYQQLYGQAIEQLAGSLTRTLLMAWEARRAYDDMQQAAVTRYRERFSREVARPGLEAIYECCRG